MKVLTDGQFADLHLHFFGQLSIYLILLHGSTQASSVWYLQLPCSNKSKGVYFFLFSISVQSSCKTSSALVIKGVT